MSETDGHLDGGGRYSAAGTQKKWVVDDRLFSPYVQTELGRLQGGKGTGLGLALTKDIVNLVVGGKRFSFGRAAEKTGPEDDHMF